MIAQALQAEPDMLAHALAYAERGFALCPASVPEYMLVLVQEAGFKHAFSRRHRRSATCDACAIRRWFSRFPKANILIRTGRVSNLVVLDFDYLYGGRPTWERLRAELPDTLQANTANGVHLYYSYPDEFEVPTSFRQVEAGLDVLGEGGFVIAPPSRHRQGSRYRFDDPAVPITRLPNDFAARCLRVTPQPFDDPRRREYASMIRDCINLTYAYVVTVPDLLLRIRRRALAFRSSAKRRRSSDGPRRLPWG